MGLINDHVEGCVVREQVTAARVNFERPTPTPIPTSSSRIWCGIYGSGRSY